MPETNTEPLAPADDSDLQAKLDHALAELSALRDHRAHWQTEHERAERLQAELAKAERRRDRAENRASLYRDQVIHFKAAGDTLKATIEQTHADLADLVGVDPHAEWGDILDSAHQAIGGA